MSLKKSFLTATVISAIFWLIWLLGYFSPQESELSRQTYSIMGNIKLLVAVAFYIAWRVTPDKS